jgi:hypothetical protein
MFDYQGPDHIQITDNDRAAKDLMQWFLKLWSCRELQRNSLKHNFHTATHSLHFIGQIIIQHMKFWIHIYVVFLKTQLNVNDMYVCPHGY